METLKIKHIIPNLSSFVCLGHFEDADLIEDEDSGNAFLYIHQKFKII